MADESVTGVNATLIVNTRARTGRASFEHARDCLRAHGICLDAAHALDDPSRLPEMVRDAMRRGAKRIVVGGGDGTFRSIAGSLAHTETTLGILPLGTVNDLARNLGIAPTVERACEVIAQGHVEKIELGQANEDHFIITASVGFSALSQTALTPEMKRTLGPCGYLLASLIALHRLREMKITVRKGARSETLEVIQAGAVNGHSWMGGAFEVPGLNFEKGRLAFYALPAQPVASYLRIARQLKHGQFFHTDGLHAFMTDEVTIETATPHPIVLDGDLCGQTPVRLRILPGALKVFAPASGT